MKPITLLVGFALFVAIVIPTINAESLASAEAEADADADADADAQAVAEAFAEAFADAKIDWQKLKEQFHEMAVKVTDWARKQLEKK
ncbi:mRNA 3'-end-processing protein RNA14-like [Ooceraea biroi]|uniref:mRNA 3'-end-processing protein RNA14-like n=1 Tax=Ooceraea biroi TaxID=2015173 RepID=UPI000F07FC8C|nr:mRNA 3'-end-processing protein RNA14-like [Ooceraea biroi]